MVHTASPFPLGVPKSEDSVVKPAVEGTLAVMKAAHKHKVKRVVITSSCAAVFVKSPANFKPAMNENDWSEPEICKPYEKSKTLAEKAAWDYLEALPENEKFELVVINPALILGPSLVNTDFTSGLIIKNIMTGS